MTGYILRNIYKFPNVKINLNIINEIWSTDIFKNYFNLGNASLIELALKILIFFYSLTSEFLDLMSVTFQSWVYFRTYLQKPTKKYISFF